MKPNVRVSEPLLKPRSSEAARPGEPDPFDWLEAQWAPETRAFLDVEGARYQAYLKRHRALRNRIEPRVAQLLSAEVIDLPISDQKGGLVYLKRTGQAEQKSIYHRDSAGQEAVLLTVASTSSSNNSSLSLIRVSSDAKLLAFGIRDCGEDAQQIGFFDLESRSLLNERLPRGSCRGLAFHQRGVYYSLEDSIGLYAQRRAVRFHCFGQSIDEDVEIYCAGDGPSLRLLLSESEDGSRLGYLELALERTTRCKLLIQTLPLDTPPREVMSLVGGLIAPRIWSTHVEALANQFTGSCQLIRIDSRNGSAGKTDILLESTRTRLDSLGVWGSKRVVHCSKGAEKFALVMDQTGKQVRKIPFPTSGTVEPGALDAKSGQLYYSHSDINVWPSIHRVSLDTGMHELWWQQSLSGPAPQFQSESRVCTSRDGTPIPLDIVKPKVAHRNHPVLLTAYGAGGASLTPRYSVLQTILLEAGFTCVVAHVRGGGEGGSDWHAAGRGRNKQNSVDDFLAAAEWLVEAGYTTRDHLGVAGQSAGGLLVLCAVTQRSELFRAALALGPLTDLKRFHLFGAARSFVGELGSPDNPEDFMALSRLSPYHHVEDGRTYPATLLISGDSDQRCDSLHARKMAARLREVSSRKRPALLDYTTTRGHKAVLPLSERIRSLTDRLTFLMAELLTDEETKR